MSEVSVTMLKRNLFLCFVDEKMRTHIFLQEAHSGDSDVKFWKAQWGDQCYFIMHLNNQQESPFSLTSLKEPLLSHSLQLKVDE